MNKVPKLRFPGFSREWSYSNILDICVINPKTDKLPSSFYYIDLESVEKGVLIKNTIVNQIEAPSRAQRLLKENDVLFQMVRPYQMNNYHYRKDKDIPTVASTGYAQLRSKECSSFLYYLLHTEKFNKEVLIRCTGSNYPAINSNELSEIEVATPDITEQGKIASFFTLIDEKIQKQQKKVEALRDYKKGIIQKIFSQEIRFYGFNNEWKSEKLWKFAEKITKKNKGYVITNVISNSAKNGLVSQRDYFDKDIANEDNIDGYYVIKPGDFVYNPRKSAESPYGPINRYESNQEGIVSPLYLCFEVNKDIDGEYLAYYFKSDRWHRFIYLNSDQGVRHDRVSIKDSEFFNLELSIPTLDEQRKIASFLSTLDRKVIIEQDKLIQLNQWKKSLLQQMFV
jgi:type I restriction enzyme S subunit